MNINIEINELKRRQSELEDKYAAILSAMKSLDSLFRENRTTWQKKHNKDSYGNDLKAYEEAEDVSAQVSKAIHKKGA